MGGPKEVGHPDSTGSGRYEETEAARVMANKKPSFEEALKQLEEITARIERGEIGLEESITQYEKGMGLVKQCRDILTKAEHKIQQLQEKSDGSLAVKPYKTKE